MASYPLTSRVGSATVGIAFGLTFLASVPADPTDRQILFLLAFQVAYTYKLHDRRAWSRTLHQLLTAREGAAYTHKETTVHATRSAV